MNNFTDNFWKKFFVLASLWNISAAPLCLILYIYFPSLIYTSEGLQYTHNPVFDSFYYIVVGAVLLFGVGYYMPSRDLMLNRGIIWLGAIAKIGLAVVIFQMYFLKYLTLLVPILLVGDIIWALFFFVFLNQTKDRVKVNNLVG
ncbi:MAG: hypothetical protein NT072_03750 [Deltaproteobacteria bacterium]|nr:hypothetical protein [Deltaproteobacteria bacterium]